MSPEYTLTVAAKRGGICQVHLFLVLAGMAVVSVHILRWTKRSG